MPGTAKILGSKLTGQDLIFFKRKIFRFKKLFRHDLSANVLSA